MLNLKEDTADVETESPKDEVEKVLETVEVAPSISELEKLQATEKILLSLIHI